MPILHRYNDELTLLENEQVFCGEPINNYSNILVIGTFNPDDESCLVVNDATWFYGRHKNRFWEYLPIYLIGESLHQSEGYTVANWRQFCINNRIVIVDLIKAIDHENALEDFKDRRLNDKINNQLTNLTPFDFTAAFENTTFQKVIYTRKGWDPTIDKDISKLIQLKNTVNNLLLQNNIINNLAQIKYCPAPWQRRRSTGTQWGQAIQ